jgi:antitoxin VapB
MSLNNKHPDAHRLAAELAHLTGESLTKAVTKAIQERRDREKRRRDQAKLTAELLAIGRRCASQPRRDERSPDTFLYGERGLPR